MCGTNKRGHNSICCTTCLSLFLLLHTRWTSFACIRFAAAAASPTDCVGPAVFKNKLSFESPWRRKEEITSLQNDSRTKRRGHGNKLDCRAKTHHPPTERQWIFFAVCSLLQTCEHNILCSPRVNANDTLSVYLATQPGWWWWWWSANSPHLQYTPIDEFAI